MTSFHEAMMDFRIQLEHGVLQQAYSGLMAYFRDLRSHFLKTYPEYKATSIYYGYMDMTYFALIPEWLRLRRLKIAIVFEYETFRFEVWLSGANRAVQATIWNRIQDQGWNRYRLAGDPRREDYILSQVLSENPDFRDLAALTTEIEQGSLAFLQDVEIFFKSLPA